MRVHVCTRADKQAGRIDRELMNPRTARARYGTVVGLKFFQELTKIITAALPNARVGANFSPYDFFTDPRDGVG